MSLLEDVFLQDEAGEAQELERVIEGDDLDERPRDDSDDDSEKDDEAVEDKRRVDPSNAKPKKVVKNPRVTLNPARLSGPRGIQVIPDHFKDFKFKGKGHEKEDFDLVLKKLEHWAYRLFPKFQFDDCLHKIETLGKKRPVMVHLHKIRSDQYETEETVVQQDSSGDEAPAAQPVEEDEFDKLLQQQIELARATPAPGSARKGFETPSTDKRSPFTMPKATSSPSISDEQKERMMRNRKLAEERRLARLTQNTPANITTIVENDTNNQVIEVNNVKQSSDVNITRKHNRSNVIDSSDEEIESPVVHSTSIDVHKTDSRNAIEIDEESNPPSKTEESTMIDLVGEDKPTNSVNLDGAVIDMTNVENTIPKEIIGTVDLVNADENSNDEIVIQRQNRRAVIDSSDDECEVSSVNHSVVIDIHNNADANTIDKHTLASENDKEVDGNEREIEPQHMDTTETKDASDATENDKEDTNNQSQNIHGLTESSTSRLSNIAEVDIDDDIEETASSNDKDMCGDANNGDNNELMDVDFNDDF